jgi:hypothetical protein
MTTQMGTHHRGYCCSKMRHTHSHHRCCFLCVPFRWLGFANKYTGRTVSWELGHHYQNPDKRSPSGFRMARCPHQSGTWQSPFQALGSHPFEWHVALTNQALGSHPCAGRWAGGQGGATADTWQFVCWPRGRGTPNHSRLPNDRSGPRVEAALRGCC